MRKQFVMSAEDRATILEACRPVPYMLILGAASVSQQERANTAWKALGARMGFDGMTVQPVPGQPDMVFTAEEAPVSVAAALPVQMLDAESASGWMPLTDEDRERAFKSLPDMLDGFMKTWGWLHFAKAIEAICEEKNPPAVATPAIWLAIESAPKDGSEILLGRAANEEMEQDAISVPGYWQAGYEDGVDDMGVDDGFVDSHHQVFGGGRSFGAESYRYAPNQPTHWMPLPTPPVAIPGAALPAHVAATGALLDGESLEQGDASCL